MRAPFVFLLILACCSSIFSQVRITTFTGEKFEGYNIFESDSTIKISDLKGQEFKINYKSLLSKDKITSNIITHRDFGFYCHVSKVDSNYFYYIDENKNQQKIPRNEIKEFRIKTEPDPDSYLIVGGTIIMGGGINFLLGYQMPANLTLKLQFGVLSFLELGSQINFGYNFVKNDLIDVNATIGTGFAFNQGDATNHKIYRNFWYYGGFADISLSVIYLELGYVTDDISFDSPKLHFQAGLVFRIY